jgi:hypothetical protein
MESDLDKSAILVCFVVYADSATPKPASKIKQLIIHVLYFQEFKNYTSGDKFFQWGTQTQDRYKAGKLSPSPIFLISTAASRFGWPQKSSFIYVHNTKWD